jgi:hypothetical protein
MKFTLEEIKDAFWRRFHHGGEMWLPYPPVAFNEEECHEATNMLWLEFVKEGV